MGLKSTLTGYLLGLLVLSIMAEEEAITPGQIKLIPDKFPEIPYEKETSQLVAQSVMNFAHNLAVALDKNEYPNTQIFSPLSVMSVLSIIQMGSYGNSYNQLNKLFTFLNKENSTISSAKIHEEFGWLLTDVQLTSDVQMKRNRSSNEFRSRPFTGLSLRRGGKNNLPDQSIRISNGLFLQNGYNLRPDYAYAADSVYKSEVTPLDFMHYPGESKDYINSWVNQNTFGKIPTLIDGNLSPQTKLIVASTLYFKGFWETTFVEVQDDTKEPFYPDGPDSIPVAITLMHTIGVFPSYQSKEHKCLILGLPYKGNETTMYIIQPDDSTRLNLQQLQKNLTGEVINELISKMEYDNAFVSLPKFHVQNKFDLKESLKLMGIEDIFKNDQANMALIADPEENTIEPKSSPISSFASRPVPIPEYLEDAPSASSSSVSNAFDRYGDAPLLFSRFSEDSDNQTTVTTDKPKLESQTLVNDEQESTTIVPEEEKPLERKTREATPISPSTKSLQKLDQLRTMADLKNPHLYVDEIIHKIDFNVNEEGTEAAAASVATFLKSGPPVRMRCDKPFLILVRHDPTKLPLFYGIINIPV